MKTKELLKPILTLLLAAALLVGVKAALCSVAARKAQEDRDLIFSYLLMEGAPFTEEIYDGEDESIRAVYKGSNGYIVEVTAAGYADEITMWVGVKNDGYVTGLTVRDMAETHGLGREALFDQDFLLQYLRSEGDAAVGEDIDALTGATVSSKAVTKAVNSAVAFVTGADISSGATEWGG